MFEQAGGRFSFGVIPALLILAPATVSEGRRGTAALHGQRRSRTRDTARAMSEENVSIAVGYFVATDLDQAIDALADDVTFVFHGESRHLAGAGAITGKKAAIEWLADWFSRFDPDYRMEVIESRDWGNRVLVVTNHHATGRASAVPISQQTAQVMTLAGGKIVRQDFFPSRDQALETVGLRG